MVDQHSALTTHSYPDRNRWLIAIGVLKLLKAVLFVSMGFGVIRLLHKDVADVLLRVTTALRFDPENRFVNVLLEKSALLSPHRLKEISLAIFLYAALDVIEGTGLVLEKVWAEYVTLVLTGSFLPWEFYEILRHVTVLKIVLTILNALVFVYLVIVVTKKFGCASRDKPLLWSSQNIPRSAFWPFAATFVLLGYPRVGWLTSVLLWTGLNLVNTTRRG